MLKFLKNHPRLKVLIVFVVFTIVSSVMLFQCTKNTDTYLQSKVEHKVEINQKNNAPNKAYQQLLAQDQQQKIQQAERKNSSYIGAIFSTSSTPEVGNVKSENQINTHQRENIQIDPVTFYNRKQNQQNTENGSVLPSSDLYNDMDSFAQNEMSNPQLAQKNLEVILQAWNKVPTMRQEIGVLASDGAGSGALNTQAKLVRVKAGDVLIAVIDTAVNSDQPGTPILAHIVVGPYKNAKLLGGFVREQDKLIIKFTTLSLLHRTSSMSINAYAIDQNTAQTALSSDVDHHYLLRYGSLFAAAFLQGFGTFFSNGQTNSGWCFVDPLGEQHCQGDASLLTAKNAAYAGLGQIGTSLGTAVGKQFDKPPTVTLDQGSAIGVLIMQDIEI